MSSGLIEHFVDLELRPSTESETPSNATELPVDQANDSRRGCASGRPESDDSGDRQHGAPQELN